MGTIKPTFTKPISPLSKGYQKTFDKVIASKHVKLNEFDINNNLNEVDNMLDEAEFSLKKKIFSLPKMEALIFSDPMLSAKYEEMSKEGETRYGYHYNELISNMLFNDYVLNSPKYLQKYRQAIPKEKKRRDKSGINQLKKAGKEMQTRNIEPKPVKPVTEGDKQSTPVIFLVNERDPKDPDLFAYFPEENYDNKGVLKMGYSHTGQHSAVHPSYADEYESREATPQEYADLKRELEGLGYNLDVLNGQDNVSETSGTGGAGGGGAFSGSGQYSQALDYKRPVQEDDSEDYGEENRPDNLDSENDCVISSNGWKYSLSCAGKFEGDFNEVEQALQRVKKWQKENNYYPNTWFVSDHGNESLIDLEGNMIKETTGSASSGAYVGPAVWGSGDLMKTKGTANVKKVPMVKGGKIIQENVNYLIESNGFEKYFNQLNETIDIENPTAAQKPNEKPYTNNKVNNKIISDTSAFTSNAVKQWNKPDTELELHTVNTGMADEPNLKTMEESKKINEKAKSASQQRLFGMAHAVQKGELSPSKVGGAVKKIAKSVSSKDVKDFAKTKHKDLPEKIDEDSQSMIGDNPITMANKPAPIGTQSSNMDMGARSSGGGGMNESIDLLEEINNELKAFSIHQDKLKKLSEDRKPASLVLKDRLGNDNQKNFKADLKDSSISKLVDIENSLEYKDQQTEIGDNPYKLGQDIEKKALKTGDMKSGEALKNVGNSTNDDGDEIPKRNLSDTEQDEVNLYRLGLGDMVYDNEVGSRFEDRMKADMGEKNYALRQKRLEFRGKSPMYNKDNQPIADTTADKVQFDKEQTGWNEREGLKEGVVNGKYFDKLGKKRIIDFNLNEVMELKNDKKIPYLHEVNLEGLGNIYAKVDSSEHLKIGVNESTVKAIQKFKFYTDGTNVVAFKGNVQNLSESEQKGQKPVINEQMNKMKHLLNYKPDTFTNTKGTKENRGF